MSRILTRVLVSAAVCLSGASAHAEPFTLVVMPDTQSEATNTPQVKFPAMTRWIVDNRAAMNIEFVAHVGDLVNWETPNSNPPQFQYVNADAAMDLLDVARIPYAICIGNHDTAAVGGVNPDGSACHCGGSAGPGNTKVNVRNTTVFNQFFPLSRFTNVDGVYEPGKVDNVSLLFSAGGLDWMVVSVELDPRAGALAWANKVISDHPDHNVIYLTHNYLAPSGNLAGGVGYADLNPQAVWDGLIKLHSNIRFVLSGHLTQTAMRQPIGKDGRKIYEILTDYQDDGNGWLRTLVIDPQAKTVKSRVYSPYLEQYKTGPTEEFTLTGVEFVPARRAPPLPDAGSPGSDAGGEDSGADEDASSGGDETDSAAPKPETGGAGTAAGGASSGGSPSASGGALASGGTAAGAVSGAGAATDAGTASGSDDSGGCGCRLSDPRGRASGQSIAALMIAAIVVWRRSQRRSAPAAPRV